MVGLFWSGKHHRVVKGINLIVMVYTDVHDRCMPVNFRLYDPGNKKKSKHLYFIEMVREVLGWGLKPRMVTADSWYSAGKLLRFLRSQELGFLMGVKRDRTVSDQPHVYQRVDSLDMVEHKPYYTHLRDFGFVHVYRTVAPDQEARYYIYYDPEEENKRLEGEIAKPEGLSYDQFKEIKRRHWHIEQLFYVIKRDCRAEKFFVRMHKQVHNHMFCVLRAYQKLAIMAHHKLIGSIHQLRDQLYQEATRNFILDNTA
jgi:SRSO17 transposase